MDERAARVFLGLSLLCVLWIGVYWMWQPSAADADPHLSFGHAPPLAQPATRPESLPNSPPAALPTTPARTSEPSDPSAAQVAAPTIVQPAFDDYLIRPGDTLEKIAQSRYGSRAQWRAIAAANPLRDPARLKPGDVIRLPRDPGNIQGRPASAPSARPSESAPEKDPPPPSVPSPAEPADAVVTYTVRPGDTLGAIARRYYGSTGFDEFVYFNNRDVLSSPDRLSVGMVLRLPPVPPEDR